MSAADDMRSEAAAERLLEDSWQARSRRLPRRELISECVAAVLFATATAALALGAGATAFRPGIAVVLVAMYAVLARVEFPVGGGNVVPTHLALFPMLVLLPPAAVPVTVALGLLLAKLWDWGRGQGPLDRAFFAIPDAWHAVGAALVVVAAGAPHLDSADLPLLAAAFAACCAFDAGSAMLRESAARGIAPTLQFRVFALVWVVDACLAPIGVLAAHAAGTHPAAVLMVLPLAGLLGLLARDRRARIGQAQHRLELVVRERSRLQSAVRRLGDAFAAKLDLDAVLDIVLRGSIEALDADGGLLRITGHEERRLPDAWAPDLDAALAGAGAAAERDRAPTQLASSGVWAVALPFDGLDGVVCIARRERLFQDDEVSLLAGLVAKAQAAAAEILSHQALREQVLRDPLTGLGNRRKLAEDAGRWPTGAAAGAAPRLMTVLDLDGFKSYNDTFGHLAGDALLARLGARLSSDLTGVGDAYRLGGDEFCVVCEIESDRVEDIIDASVRALTESGEEFSISAAYGVVLLPHEADNLEVALQLADERMYAQKHSRSSGAGEQARDVLVRTLHARQPSLGERSSEVAQLAAAVARRLGMTAEEIDEVARAAELHDVGKVGIPDAILDKPGPLDAAEWEFMRQHTILGERILNAAPALRPVAALVRSSHERWDGAGYPDALAGTAIPRGARVIAVCDAYEAMTSDRPYRRGRPAEAARAELRAMAGTQFDPEVVDAFLQEIETHATRRIAAVGGGGRQLDAVAARVRTLLAEDGA